MPRSYIDHEAPRHQCPICNHFCRNPRSRQPKSTVIGRPPVAREKLLGYLKTMASKARPATIEQLAEAMGWHPGSVPAAIYRINKRQPGTIRQTPEGGYYLGISLSSTRASRHNK